MELKEQIKMLVELQKLDTEIFKFKRKKTEIPAMMKALEDEYKAEQAKLKESENTFKSVQVKHKGKENDLQTKEDTIKKYQTQLMQIKTNKEYDAMKHEIAGVQADKSILEDEIINLLDEIDAGKKNMDEAKNKLKEEENKINARKKEVEKELKDIEARLTQEEQKRKELSAKVDKGMLSKYERILSGKNGLAMVPVAHSACGGCHMNLPPQVINEIKMTESIIFCESCARILYIEE